MVVQYGIGVVLGVRLVQEIPFSCDGLVCLFDGPPSEIVPVSEHVLVQVSVLLLVFVCSVGRYRLWLVAGWL